MKDYFYIENKKQKIGTGSKGRRRRKRNVTENVLGIRKGAGRIYSELEKEIK